MYKVYYSQFENPCQIETWLEKLYEEDGLILIACGDGYWIFDAAQQSVQADEFCSCGSSINANVVLGDGVVRCTVCRKPCH